MMFCLQYEKNAPFSDKMQIFVVNSTCHILTLFVPQICISTDFWMRQPFFIACLNPADVFCAKPSSGDINSCPFLQVFPGYYVSDYGISIISNRSSIRDSG